MRKSMPMFPKIIFAIAVAVLTGAYAVAEAPPETASSPPTAAAPTHRVARAPFRVEAALDGVFEARRAYEIAIVPELWSSFVVEKAVPHGTRVEKGQVLVAFEAKELERAIEEEEKALRLAKIALRQAEIESEIADRTSAMDLRAAERQARRASEDLERFLKIDKAYSLKSAEFSLKNAKNALEYEQEELRQLEKMYSADDLTEETEEIILKRQRDTVEAAAFRVEGAKKNRDETFEVDVPRRETDLKEAKTRGEVGLEKSKALAPLSLKRRQLELEKTRREVEKAAEKLSKLRRDRSRMEVKAPADGIVYWGRLASGFASDLSTIEAKLRKGGSVLPKETFMTVVVPSQLAVRAAVPEAELYKLQGRVRGVAVPTGFPDLEIPVALERAPLVPEGRGAFSARFRVEGDLPSPAVVPGMTCKLKLISYEKKRAIAIPARALFKPEAKDASPCVFVRKPDGSVERREVKTGRRSGDWLEVIEGLREGEEVFLEKPTVAL